MSNGCVKTCSCNASMSNTGTECAPLMEVIKKLVLVNIYDSTGTRNSVDVTGVTTIDAAFFTALVNQADASKRWYPLPELKNINDVRDTPVVEEFADSTTAFISEGVRKFQGLIVGKAGSPQLKGKLEAARCNEMGVYGIDRKGNLIGIISDDGTKLYPIRIDQESLSIQFMGATDTTTQKLQVNFNFHPDESDSCLRMIAQTEMDDANLLTLKGLVDVYATYSSITTAGFTVKLSTDYGTPLTPVLVKGMTAPDFISSVGGATSKVRRTNNTPADVAVTVVESTTIPGQYAVTFGVAQTSLDEIQVLLKHNGYDFTDMLTDTIAIP
jgi:hypothetical protein